ncbi:NAD-dependent epimerase/dehydratase family protein (plasmid) [Chryseobacterium panacisoli]|uniref:NAD-dependent epimerase/dehydratase family protein n=1 Tax=Chryseobacterium panacisoli TaxID=1807141 RepID=A0A5D8ZVM7_9FLAO|nr:NAD-dependent epimerase/dehydratase family protein [Chryseobacterium panacisoli]TZF98919.1 NAD-dependent epimerase/dehydratase family protein [Chryseobacterium panacisoli]
MKVIITGATGLVGEGVLLVCLENPEITEVLIINRKSLNRQHNKLKELIVKDFSEIGNYVAELNGYDACFFCAGVSSVGETEESFTMKTYGFVVPFAETLSRITSGMTFIYVSGNRTDSTEQGKVMWARVKGRTENALLKLPFKTVYNFRPGLMRPVKGQKNVRFIYRIFDALSPLWYLIFPQWICRMEEVGQAMINCVSKGYPLSVLEVKDIKISAQ